MNILSRPSTLPLRTSLGLRISVSTSRRPFHSNRPFNMEKLPHLLDIERLSPRVIRILGDNPSKFTLQGTNTYLIGQGPKRLLLDTGEGKPAWKDSLQKALKDEGAVVEKVILTHWHPDHVGGVQDVLDLSSSGNESKPSVYKNQLYPSASQIDFQDGTIFKTEGATIKAFHSPGHTVDHMSFLLLEENAMFTGDNVLGHGTAVFEDLPAYMSSLSRMETAFMGRAYPAHGQLIDDGPAKVREYIQHRKQREQEVLNVLRGTPPGGGVEGWTSREIVEVVYRDYPENLWGPAEGGVKQVLGKLEKDGRVVHVGERWKVSEKKAAL